MVFHNTRFSLKKEKKKEKKEKKEVAFHRGSFIFWDKYIVVIMSLLEFLSSP